MSLMKFDLENVTTETLKGILPQLKTLKMVAMAKNLALVATECPPEWGDPTRPETYSKQPFKEVLAVAWKELQDAIKALDATVEGVEFNLDLATPEEFDAMVRELDSNDPEKMATALAKFVRKCPKAWGDPAKKETYLNLRHYPQFVPLVQALSKAGVSEMENFLKLLT